MKFDALVKIAASDFEFRRFGEGGDQTVAVMINSLHIDLDIYKEFKEVIQKRRRNSVIMLVVGDFLSDSIKALHDYEKFVDVFLVPTPEMRNLMQAFTERPIEILFDPIDFCLTNSSTRTPTSGGPLRVAWYGYPESYGKSMAAYDETLFRLHEKGEIEYNIITKNDHYGVMKNCIIHEYKRDNFLSLLQTFDVCVLSHASLDFSIGPFLKSENKAVLAINQGLPAVASRTPAYERFLIGCGLEEYLFSSNIELIDALKRLQHYHERERYLKLSQDIVLQKYNCHRMAEQWLQIYSKIRSQKIWN
jgi:glycosyltransferase involved in cell wall biosynthesis